MSTKNMILAGCVSVSLIFAHTGISHAAPSYETVSITAHSQAASDNNSAEVSDSIEILLLFRR